jgi:hypothetical protein
VGHEPSRTSSPAQVIPSNITFVIETDIQAIFGNVRENMNPELGMKNFAWRGFSSDFA